MPRGRIDDRDAAVAVDADRQPLAVGRQGAGSAASGPTGDAVDHLQPLEVHDGDGMGRGQGDVGQLAVGRHGDAARLEAEVDGPTRRELVPSPAPGRSGRRKRCR